ncbi:hypothetical protein HK44_014765 [Pseudomonas fluorescens HK44]|uniref:Uncharacterized protein n=1 Tax=Pseudomonas fluorescens HK44 TaxID=1042209 RepID=A0A010RHS1_PSEFL|nr:hypothetical protein HK44_014765 [Pseudomonas fluorescens HK44]
MLAIMADRAVMLHEASTIVAINDLHLADRNPLEVWARRL